MTKLKPKALLAALAFAGAPIVACNSRSASPPPPVDDSARGGGTSFGTPAARSAEPSRPRMSTGKKLVILGGAAALYYMYKHHQAAQGTGADGQYYLSKNGRVYYRDAEHRAHWVTAPADGVRVPEDEARQYSELQGYENRSTGRDLSELPEARNANQ